MTHDDHHDTHDARGTDGLGALLTAAAPEPVEAPAATHRALARQVVAADRGVRARLRRTRRHRRAAAVAAAAVVLVPSGAWAAQHFLAQTGTFGDRALNPGLQDGSELIDTCAADVTDYIATLAPTDLPLAPGHTWREYAADEARSWADPGGCPPGQVATAQETDLRLGLLSRSSGDWGCVLVWADRDADPAGVARARAAMASITQRSQDLATLEGTGHTWDPDVFLANSHLPQFTGCE